MIRSGEFVRNFVGPMHEYQVQPNGVDLTLGELYKITETPEVRDDDFFDGNREFVPVGEADCYWLKQGVGYIVVYNELIEIPTGYVGYVLPRSRIPRAGGYLTSALWDQGYKGKGEGCITVFHNRGMGVEQNMRVGQLILIEAEEAEGYDGTFQHERLEE